MNITFLGATQTVTGSKYLLEEKHSKVLVDCGLFQGLKELRLRNRAPFPVDPKSIDAVVLTHAHLDHSGYVPLLIRSGFAGKVYCTPATLDLCRILLPDSGHIQEEEAEYANRKGFSKHHPALPLYTREDAERSLEQFKTVGYEKDFEPAAGIMSRFTQSGHILGSAFVRMSWGQKSIVFSGDLGRPDDPVMLSPEKIAQAHYLVIESTYGDRSHSPEDPSTKLADVINRTVDRGGSIVIPAFAVGRSQSVLYNLFRLKRSHLIPDIPIYLDSPMSVNAMTVLCNHVGEHRLTNELCEQVVKIVQYINTSEQSRRIDESKHPIIILSANGMATGGRVLHHIKKFGPDPKSTILFTGYQALGTRGADMLAGRKEVKIHGGMVAIRAEIASIENLSAHADCEETLAWLKGFERPPIQTFITHGEPASASGLQKKIEETLGWKTVIPAYEQTIQLGS